LSSTTESGSERGQILVIFAFSLLVIFGVAALVFDGGSMLLEKRAQQNAADAAALAGARFLPGNVGMAESAAYAVAEANGFVDGADGQSVDVHIPPQSGQFAGRPGHIQVVIDAEKPSFFAGIWGIISHDVGSRAVAANQTGVRGPFALLSLDPTGCEALIVEGRGELISNGNIQVNSTCTPNALRLAGQGEILTADTVACNIAGGFSAGGQANYTCQVEEGVQAIPDPLAGLDEPPIPTDGATPPNIVYPAPPDQVGGATKAIPAGCPDPESEDAATHEEPLVCQFNGSYAGTEWRLYPGYYPGGLLFEAGTFYLEPGIYYAGGGGIQLRGASASVISVEAGTETRGGGVLLYNGDHATAPDGPFDLGGGGSSMYLEPLDAGSQWDGIVMFQDREVCLDARIVAAASDLEVRGTIYIPCGKLVVEGNGGSVTTDQIIAYRFQMKGNVGTLTVAYDDQFLPSNSVAGLVE
jgi:hypothetical protein